MTKIEKMQYVIELARKAMDSGELPIAAAIFHEDKLISSAYTSERADGRWLVHAEQKALMDADEQGPPFKIRAELELYTNLEPCLMCLGMVMSSFIGSIHYALEAPEDGAIELVRTELEKRKVTGLSQYRFPKIESGLLRDDSKQLFLEFAAKNKGKSGAAFAMSLASL
ncbi:MAG: nucleoside deaminase [Defluviitaleaceae bacterium]|nr:nucleoside deaminase [Defluviitaleaceae bacterium]